MYGRHPRSPRSPREEPLRERIQAKRQQEPDRSKPSSAEVLWQRRSLGHSVIPVRAAGQPQVIQRSIWAVKKKDLLALCSRIRDVKISDMVRQEGLALIASGDLFYDSELTKSRAVPKPKKGTVEVYIPSFAFWSHSADNQLDFDAAAIHELTHAAEVMAKVRKGGYEKSSAVDLMTNPRDTGEATLALDQMLKMLDNEAKLYKSIPFKSVTSRDGKTLYGFIEDRLLYALQAISSQESNYEAVTVVNQILHVLDVMIDERGHEELDRSPLVGRIDREATLFDRAREGS